jgi:hypothetical protein
MLTPLTLLAIRCVQHNASAVKTQELHKEERFYCKGELIVFTGDCVIIGDNYYLFRG